MTAHRPLTVAHVTAERGFSGGEVQVFLLAEALRKRGHRNVLLCPAGSRSEQEARSRGLEALPIRARAEWSPRSFRSISRRLRQAAPDLVHLHTQRAAWLGGVVVWWLALPAVATRRMDRVMKRGWRNRFVYARAVGGSVAISQAVARHLSNCGVSERAIRVIPSAVDPDRLVPQLGREAVRRKLGVEAGAPCLFVAAALIERKGIDVLLEAVARLATEQLHPTLWIAGEGPRRGALERLMRVRGLEDQVHFLGPRDDVADLLAACDVFVLPSRLEGLGVSALEAMALGRPVVASRVGGLAEAVVHERTGLLVPPEDAAALCAGLARLLRDQALRQRLGAAGPARIDECHSVEAMADAYERLYDEVLRGAMEGRARAAPG
jgi:glycosyltransferase involved in cell wall biosynthesis